MNSQDQVVSFMDLLDLDEEIIDNRLKTIMKKDKHTNKHLSNAIYLLQYKQLVNLQDDCDCENNEELEFAAKLIKGMNEENISNVCQIVANILSLNSSTLINNSEHLLQQILADIDIPVFTTRDCTDSPENNSALLNFKISDSILDTVIKKGEKVALPFLELPLKGILHSGDEKLKIHFLTNTVPKFFEGVCGYNILDNIWSLVKGLQGNRTVALNVLSALSEYFLPVADSSGKMSFQSEIVYQYEFWDNVFHGLLSSDPSLRKISMYLAKRALDCVIAFNKNICVKSSNNTIFTWDSSNRKIEKVKWDNFFILIDSLEEKQSNIVLPSLQLFGSLKSLGNWLNCAFNIGLKHDNTQVRLKCIQHRLDIKLKSLAEATVLLEALNDINIYDNEIECEDLKNKLLTFILDSEVFVHFFTAIPDVKWSPVPFHHITSVLSAIKFKNFIAETNLNITKSITDILKVPCNHIAIRKAIFVNITDFIGNNCIGLHWRDMLSIFCILQSEIIPDNNLKNPLMKLIPKNIIKDNERTLLYKVIFDSHLHIDFGLLYLQHNISDLPLIIDRINLLLDRIKGIVSRQYSEKSEHLQDLLYLMQLYMKTNKQIKPLMGTLNLIIAREFKTILYYILSLLSSNIFLTIDEINVLSVGFTSMTDSINTPDVKETLLQLYKAAVLLIKDRDTVLETKVLSMFLIISLTRNTILLLNYKHEMLSLKEIISLTLNFDNKQSVGRFRNMFYEKSCKIVETLMKCHELNKEKIVKDVTEFIDNVIECGGYGCLRHCIHIMNAILSVVLEKNESLNYNITLFINRIWKEIEELKSNNQYNPCIEEFVNLITHDELLKRSMYNNIVILYCNKIVEYGSVKSGPLYNLVKNLSTKDITPDNVQLIYVLCEILLYAPVHRKDQRIVENLVVRILQEPKYACSKQIVDIQFNFQIQYLSLFILTKIKNDDILSNIEIFIKNRINEVFKNKQRYHGHSQAHRLLQTALQHLLLISALKPANDEMVTWCIELLGRLPHQPSVRICLEWYIAFCFYNRKKCFNQELLETIAKVPIASQFMIIYWTAKHRIQENLCLSEEYDFVMDVLLSHTMGQMFNIRLNAQYLATKLYEANKRASSKYAYTIKVIKKTFIESGKDKNFIKLQQDYFVNSFDIVNDFTPAFIYYFLPRICEINKNEYIDLPFVKDIVKQINSNIEVHDFFKKEGRFLKSDEEIFTPKVWKVEKNKVVDDVEESATIQKKYVPWKNMNDVNVYEPGKKKKNHSDLIVVASLIDKLPNLGGMARTSEVFGVKTYVVDSLRHLHDKQFQGLSVSAERWINVEEVRPGQTLKQYLLQKKAEGYSVVAAEQTSTSAKLQNFKFPKKTLLLLGHEKEGIPCDLLPMMDNCVEIPQQGFVRSLNVHVTAAIFVWEYARQNIL